MLYPDAKGNETVIIPRLPRPGEELLFGILHIFRYTIRRMSGGEFPRGFLAPGLTPRANACKKLKEELGVPAGQLTELALLGQTRTDTGLKSGQAQGYLADLTGPTPQPSVGEEGIARGGWISRTELLRHIRDGEILDGYTQTAILLYLLHKNSQS